MRFLLHIALIFHLCMGCKSNRSNQEQSKENVQKEIVDLNSQMTESQIYFEGRGTEPFWSVEISENLILFKTPSDSIVFQPTHPILALDSNVKRYDIKTASNTMSVHIRQAECTNAMSGKVSPYTVSVDLQKGIVSEVQNFEGCGEYKTDYRLHDIWVLESFNGRTVTKTDFSQEFPMMEIKAAENTFSGFAGCNQMHGTLFFEKGSLRFTNIATTRMLCETENKEAEFLKALQSSTSYTIKNNRLILSNPSGIVSIFKKID